MQNKSEYYTSTIKKFCSKEEIDELEKQKNQKVSTDYADKIIISEFQIISQRPLEQEDPFTLKKNLLIWVDRNINNNENSKYQQQFKSQYGQSFLGFRNEEQAIDKVKNSINYHLVFISSGQCAYELKVLLRITYVNILIFCQNIQAHSDLFIRNRQIKAICNSFNEIDSLQKKSMSENQIKHELQLLVSAPQSLLIPEYQHSKYHVSLQFAKIIQQLDSEYKATEEKFYTELKNLLKQNDQQFENFKQSSKKQISKAKQGLYRDLSLFETFIVIYALDDAYFIINSAFAFQNYQDIQCMMALLFDGYKDLQNQKSSFGNKLYRGIGIDQKNFEEFMNSIKESKQNQTSLTWNTLISTSQKIDVAVRFSKRSPKKCSIIFIIKLNQDSPHPFYELPDELAQYDESEVLLFPQFEFIVESYKDMGSIYEITIKQVNNNFIDLFDKNKRENYWQQSFNCKVNPKLDELISIIYIRFEQLRKVFSILGINPDRQKILKDEEFDCLERLKALTPLFEKNSIIKKKFEVVIRVFSEVIYKNKQNYNNTNYMENLKECVKSNLHNAMTTYLKDESDIKNNVEKTYEKTNEKSSVENNNQIITVQQIVNNQWQNSKVSLILQNKTKKEQSFYGFKDSGNNNYIGTVQQIVNNQQQNSKVPSILQNKTKQQQSFYGFKEN